MLQPRGPVEIMGVTTRTNTSEDRHCAACGKRIEVDEHYERVARNERTIESYSMGCFEDEFGPRGLYGD